MGETNGISARFVYAGSSDDSSLVIKSSWLEDSIGDIFTKGSLCYALGQMRKDRELVSACFFLIAFCSK
jgi:hypothetical protein